jgi:hypothetical protein
MEDPTTALHSIILLTGRNLETYAQGSRRLAYSPDPEKSISDL